MVEVEDKIYAKSYIWDVHLWILYTAPPMQRLAGVLGSFMKTA